MTHEDEKKDVEQKSPVNRRQFLGGVGATVGVLAAGLPAIGGSVAEAEELAPESGTHRRNSAFQVRHDAAIAEKQRGVAPAPTNGDEELYPNRIASYSKCLPHDTTTGEVDPAAYQTLLDAIESGQFAAFDSVPKGGTFRLANPLGGLGFNLEGPDNRAVVAAPPHRLDSAELAAEMAELYWMALCRDVPFANWDTDPTIADACADLQAMPGYTGPRDSFGNVTPQVVFRSNLPGVTTGPIVSQYLMRGFVYDAIFVEEPKILTPLPGEDFMTFWPEAMNARNGWPNGNPGFSGTFDPVRRYPRAMRDLAQIAAQDLIASAFQRAIHILRANIGGVLMDENWPYHGNHMMTGFATLGLGDLCTQVGAVCQGERPVWYSKWNLHRMLRPEEYSVLVHRVVADGADYPIHPSLLASAALPRIFAHNQTRNAARGLGAIGTYLLPQSIREGAPTHPSYPSGHAITAGACTTVIKAWWRESIGFPGPRQPTADGTGFTAYTGGGLTIGRELNKLAFALTHGRDMSGMHWRVDGVAGLAMGEEVAIRYLCERTLTYPEPFQGFRLEKFDGSQVVICDGEVSPA
jgi:hypothetical protein